MAILCRKYGFLFIMTPRTACTAVGELLLSQYGGEYLPRKDILNQHGRILVQQKHSTLCELIGTGLLTTADAQLLLKVTCVRNPFDSLVSLYHKQRTEYQPLLDDPNSWANRYPAYCRNMRYAKTHSFGQWIFKICSKRIAKTFLGEPLSMFHDYTEGVDIVMRYEDLAGELNKVLSMARMPAGISIPIVNRTNVRAGRDYRSHYSRAAAFAVRVAFSDDLKRYSYTF
jgi:hypothetical protein